jgi:hypothetical protein
MKKSIDDAWETAEYINKLLDGDQEKLIKIFEHLCKHEIIMYHASKEQMIDIFKDM